MLRDLPEDLCSAIADAPFGMLMGFIRNILNRVRVEAGNAVVLL